MKKLNFQNTITALILVCLFICSFIVVAFNTSAVAYAADVSDAISYTYDTTDVMKDLEGSEGFNVKDYPINKNDNLKILTFLEYGYSKTWNHYGLYLYIYNPQQKSLSRSSASNKANVAIAYDEKDEASSYRRFNLVFCSASDDRLFYKYRIDDSEHILLELAQAYAEKHDGTRRYDVSNAELLEYGSNLATATFIGKSYECTGFMKGFGDDKTVNTFDCKAYSIDVLDIELKHTFFRPEGTSYSNGANEYFFQSSQTQLNSVYFTFPNNLIEYYGGIWKIATSYYKYRTKPIIVMSNSFFYDLVKKYVDSGEKPKSLEMQTTVPKGIITDKIFEKYLKGSDEFKKEMTDFFLFDFPDTPIYYLFYTGNETTDGSVPLAKDFTLSGKRLLEYIYSYDKSYNTGKLDIKDNVSHDLFWTCPEYAQKGYEQLTNIEITADETYTLENMSRVSHWYDVLDHFNLGAEYRSDAYKDIRAIEPIDKSDIFLSKSDFCKKYFIAECDYNDIIECVKKDDETTYLFRFAQSDYSTIGLETTEGKLKSDTDHTFAAMQTVYLDMNISSITCRKGDVYHTFAVCSNPIDSAGDISKLPDFDKGKWWEDLPDKAKSLLDKIKDLLDEIQSWFEENKEKIISAVVAIAVMIVSVLIIILGIKLAPSRSIGTIRIQSNAPPSSPPTSKPKRQRRQKPKPKTQNKKTTQRHYRVGRRKAK